LKRVNVRERNDLNKRTKELIEEAQQLKKLRDENNDRLLNPKSSATN